MNQTLQASVTGYIPHQDAFPFDIQLHETCLCQWHFYETLYWMNEWMNDITVLRIEESLLYNSITHHKKLKRLQLILLTISFQQNQTLVKNISKYKKPKLSLIYFHLFWTTLVRLHARTAAAIPNMNKKQAACSLWKLKTLKWKRQDTQSTGQR